jgi:serine/threonine protein kinase
MNKYELIRVIGDGTYGIVYEGKNKETKEKVAIKKLKQKYRTLEECKNKIEIKILEKLYHDNIIHLKEVARDFNGEISYIFEYCDCNLLEFIETHKEKNKKIPEQIIREIILQITKGLKYLHSKNYFHRDLKPENILLILNKYDLNNLTNNINESGIKVKIADFGTAKKIPTKDALTITEYVCTRWYRSPECVLRTDNYDEKSDIWALGCIMAELYKLGAIFPGENEFDQINQIFKILGTPTKSKWPWGYTQAENLGIKFPVYYKKDLKEILGYIGQDGINLLNEIFQFDSKKKDLLVVKY